MKRWSYKTVVFHNWLQNLREGALDKTLAAAGEEGWELVSVVDGSSPRLFFKRPVPSEPYRTAAEEG